MGCKIELNDAFKTFTKDQDKIMTPEETVSRFREKIQELDLDILDTTTRIDNGRLDIPVYFSVCGSDARKLTGTNKQMGKGASPAQSEASAVMELAERFSFFSFRADETNFISSTYRDLNDKAIPFDHIAASVHDTNPDELAITKDFFSDLPLKWTWAFNMMTHEEVLIPFDWFFMINEFNGPSAGNCNEEAICQGISEIIERHVSSLVSMNSLQVPQIDPYTATDPAVLEMLEKYKRNGINLIVSDFTLDTGIPTVGVLAWDPSTFPKSSEIVWTAGTAPDPQKALSRALTEVAQLAGDFNSCSNYVASGLPKFTSLDQITFLTENDKTLSIFDLPDLSDTNIRVEVENYINVLKQSGMDAYLINTMHSDLKIPAYYTIIPGAHFRERATGTNVGMFSAKFITENLHPADAFSRLSRMNELLPGKYYLNFYLGQCALNLSQYERALTCFENAITLDPEEQDIATIYSYSGVCLKEMERYEEALDVLKKGIEADDEREDIYNLMGFCNFMLKRHETAIECFNNVLRLNPSSGIDYANIASNYRDMGNQAKAISYYKIALELDPTLDFAKTNLEKLQNAN